MSTEYVQTCPRHGGDWGDDDTCPRCTDSEGKPLPLERVVEPAPTVGSRVLIDGEEYVVNRVTVSTKASNSAPKGKARDKTADTQATRPIRAQIDLMPVAEIQRRQANLANLLDGIAAEED